MLKIVKNTYPKNGIGRHEVDSLCIWVIDRGHLILKRCDENGKILLPEIVKENGITLDKNSIFSHGQIYALNGNLLSGKKEPERCGIVAKFVKNGWFLELVFINR
jgi:hypothetical protein